MNHTYPLVGAPVRSVLTTQSLINSYLDSAAGPDVNKQWTLIFIEEGGEE